MAEIIVYTKVPCPFCVRAKRLLTDLQVPFKEIDLTDKEDEIQKIKNETGWRTVPIIMINGQLIGGFVDLKALVDEGKFESLLK